MSFNPIGSGPFEGLFETGCRNGEMNIEGVTIAGVSIDLSVKPQSYCSRSCRRAAAYGWERFQSGTRGPRRRLLTPRLEASERRPIEASETFPGSVVAGSFRKRGFYSTKSGACKGGNTPVLVEDRQWSHLYRIHWPDGVISAPANLTRCNDAIRNWVATSLKESA